MWWNVFTGTLLPNPKARFINSNHSHEPLCKLCYVTGIDLGAVTLKWERVGEWDPLEHRSISHQVWFTPRATVNSQFTWKVLRNVLVSFLTLISKKMQLGHLQGGKLIACCVLQEGRTASWAQHFSEYWCLQKLWWTMSLCNDLSLSDRTIHLFTQKIHNSMEDSIGSQLPYSILDYPSWESLCWANSVGVYFCCISNTIYARVLLEIWTNIFPTCFKNHGIT